MSTTNRNQENRFLESPYAMRDTTPQGQIPFSIKNPIGNTLRFAKIGFTTRPPMPDKVGLKGLSESDNKEIPQPDEIDFEPK